MTTWQEHPWMGVFAATLCAFHEDESLDEDGLRAYIRSLCAVPGLKGLVPNGHTGEIMSLREPERARVTRIFAEEVEDSGADLKVISGVCGEGSLSSIDHALAAKEAGADGILLMPPHHWLRFGRSSVEAVGFIADVAEGADIDIVIHQYPAWTKAGYTLKEMARWLWDYEQLKAVRPDLSIITCHDEYLLPTLLEAGDGALIGFAGFAPELMIEMVHACLEGDLPRAKEAQRMVAPLARLIYSFGEPGCAAHQRMKVAKWLLGEISSQVFRRPVRPMPEGEVQRLREGLNALGMNTVN